MKTIRPKAFDMHGVNLSAQEGFVLSRVVGTISLHDLVDLSGLGEARVLEIVRRLAEEGTVEVQPPLTPLPSVVVAVAEVTAQPFAVCGMVAVCGMTDVGLARSSNEDAFRVVDLTAAESVDVSEHTLVDVGPRGLLLVVCDGMGGENAGEIASALAVEVVCSHMATGNPREGDAAVALRAAVEHANELVNGAADDPERRGMGTTVVAVLIRGADAYTAEVGDSRAYVLRGGTLTQITKDQTYVQLLLDQGVLAPESVKGSVAKNVVLQALGKAPDVLVAQRRLALRSGDVLLLCSDGLSSFVTDGEIERVLAASLTLNEACTDLVALANERGGRDNITVVAALVSEPLPPPDPSEQVAATLTTLRAFALGEGPADP